VSRVTDLTLEVPGANAILTTSDSLPADLIVLVRDAHGGLSSWYHPSVGQRLLAPG
jgi:hypothetical protein